MSNNDGYDSRHNDSFNDVGILNNQPGVSRRTTLKASVGIGRAAALGPLSAWSDLLAQPSPMLMRAIPSSGEKFHSSVLARRVDTKTRRRRKIARRFAKCCEGFRKSAVS